MLGVNFGANKQSANGWFQLSLYLFIFYFNKSNISCNKKNPKKVSHSFTPLTSILTNVTKVDDAL